MGGKNSKLKNIFTRDCCEARCETRPKAIKESKVIAGNFFKPHKGIASNFFNLDDASAYEYDDDEYVEFTTVSFRS